ncbi:MAG: hypothetical protein KJI72_01920 [Patescibacteria group bacterium]|nr:hypothetical protein [Patescibacteria group bacterium]
MNTNKEIITQLKRLRYIEPDSAFARGSRSIVLSVNHGRTRSQIWLWTSATAVTFLFLAAVISYNALFSSKPVLSSSFNPESLEQEFSNLTINIQLEEIKYQQSVNQAIASALNEIQNTYPRHLNNSLLESEEAGINLDESINPYIDELLEKAIF